MIDFLNEIFTTVASAVRSEHTGAFVTGEYTRSPSKFPTVTIDEIENVTMSNLVDSSGEEKFSGLAYRIQVFSNKTAGKKAEARDIFKTADSVMIGLGFQRVTYMTTPEIYDSTIYSITATYEATVNVNGVFFRR